MWSPPEWFGDHFAAYRRREVAITGVGLPAARPSSKDGQLDNVLSMQALNEGDFQPLCAAMDPWLSRSAASRSRKFGKLRTALLAIYFRNQDCALQMILNVCVAGRCCAVCPTQLTQLFLVFVRVRCLPVIRNQLRHPEAS